MQILHFGRYAYHPELVAPSAVKAPISPFRPPCADHRRGRADDRGLRQCAALAQSAGYDGVEIMGSEGYLINEFIAAHTNQRDDEWGGSYENRIRFPLEIVRRTRERVGATSSSSSACRCSTWSKAARPPTRWCSWRRRWKAGVTILNTGIGWHEARIPTIATKVPRAAFAWVTQQLKGKVGIPLVATNRINTPEVAEHAGRGQGRHGVMARPFLADPDFVAKAAAGKADEINTCIGCNQACLDHTFGGKITSCLVNPRACHETILMIQPLAPARSASPWWALAGRAGLLPPPPARGLDVTLFDAANEIGGQFNMAKQVPGKEEFYETLRYFGKQIELTGVKLQLGRKVSAQTTGGRGFKQVVLATGVTPRTCRTLRASTTPRC
jgi:2,4-dienoyl-CoA reductase (NADPH2)